MLQAKLSQEEARKQSKSFYTGGRPQAEMTTQYDDLTLDELRELAMFDPEAKRALETRSGYAAPAAEPAEEDFDAASSGVREHADVAGQGPMQDYFSGAYKHRSLHDLSVASRSGDDYAGIEYCERVLSESAHHTEQEMAIRELTMIRERFSLAYSSGRAELMPILRHINLVLGYGYESLSGDKRNSDEAHQAFICYQNAYELDPNCHDSLIRCYEQGIGVDASFEKALSIRERAAENGGMEARMQVGTLFLEQNRLIKAKEWFQYALEAPDHLDDPGSDAACRYLLDNLNGNPSTNAESLLSDPAINAWGYYALSMTPGLSEGALENALARGAACPEGFAQQRCDQKWTELKAEQEARRSAEEAARMREEEEAKKRREYEASKAQAAKKNRVTMITLVSVVILAVAVFSIRAFLLKNKQNDDITSNQAEEIASDEDQLSVEDIIQPGEYLWDHTFHDGKLLRGKMTIQQASDGMTFHVDFYPYRPDAEPEGTWDGVMKADVDYTDDGKPFVYGSYKQQDGHEYSITLMQDGDVITIRYELSNSDPFEIYRSGSVIQKEKAPELEVQPNDLTILMTEADDRVTAVTSMSPETIRTSDGSDHQTGFYQNDTSNFTDPKIMIFKLNGQYTKLSITCEKEYGYTNTSLGALNCTVSGDNAELSGVNADGGNTFEFDVTGVQTLIITVEQPYGWAIVDPVVS